MNLESFHQCSEKNQRGYVTVQCRIFHKCVHLHCVRRLHHGHDQKEFEGNYLKSVPIHEISSILGSKLNHIYRAQADTQLDKHSNCLPVIGI